MFRWWYAWHRRRPLLRWETKLLAVFLVIGLLLYPRFWLIPEWQRRIGDMNSVLDPTHPGLAELEQAVRARTDAEGYAGRVLLHTERVVYERFPYAHDWDTWGVMDYLPTVAEVFEQGREDCDGLAVVSASLLRRMGHEAYLVSDLKHTWVYTPAGELMSPGQGAKTLETDAEGTRTRVDAETARNVGRGLAYGVAVFPLGREIAMLLVIWLALLHPRAGRWRPWVALAGFALALVLLRAAGASGEALALRPQLTWLGLTLAVASVFLVAWRTDQRAAA
jgi:hypothetical protein